MHDILDWIINEPESEHLHPDIPQNVHQIHSSEELEKQIQNNEVVVGYFGENKSELFDTFLSASKKFDEDIAFIYSSDLELNLKINETIIIFSNLKKISLNFFLNEQELINFIELHRFPEIILFSSKIRDNIFKRDLPNLLLFIDSSNSDNKTLEQDFRSLSDILFKKVKQCIVDIANEDGQSLAKEFGINLNMFPTVKNKFLYIFNY